MSETYEYFVGMTCGGCKGAVERVLGRADGVESYEIDVDAKKVLVTGAFDAEAVLAKLQKWGKAAKKEVRLVGKQ